MDIFISQSGRKSRAAAEALRSWLPKIVNAFKPWVSSKDIEKGARWANEISAQLAVCKAGIICVTADNLHSDWLLFETGAISKTVEHTHVCTFLIDLGPSDIQPPLAQFQATRANRDEIFKMVKTLNGAAGEGGLSESDLVEVYDVWWPKLDAALTALPDPHSDHEPKLSDRKLLEEILSTVRNLGRVVSGQPVEIPKLSQMLFLTPLEEKALEMFYGSGGRERQTIEQIAEAFATTPERIKLLLVSAQRKLVSPPPVKESQT